MATADTIRGPSRAGAAGRRAAFAAVLPAVLSIALSTAAAAQQDPLDPTPTDPLGQGQDQQQTDPLLVPPSLQGLPGQEPIDPDNLDPTWMRPEAFQGFPVFPAELGGYGRYPTAPTGFLQPPVASGQLPPPALPAAPDWPAWIKQKQPDEFPYESGIAVLVRAADRVWLRQAGDDAFVPLYHFDTARALTAGSDVQVRHTGEFQLLLHGGSRLVSFGTTDLQVVELGDGPAHVALRDFTRVELAAPSRGLVCDLPDGSSLVIDAVPEGPDAAPASPALLQLPASSTAGVALVELQRAIEPGRYSGRATIFNGGDRVVRWRTPFGERALPPGFRITLFLAPPANALPRELGSEGVEVEADGARRRFRATATGAVHWSGARFALPAGSSLQLDPLLGDPFAARPATPPDEAPK